MLKGDDGNITENAGWPRDTMCTQVAYELRVPWSSGMILNPQQRPDGTPETRHFLTQTVPDGL